MTMNPVGLLLQATQNAANEVSELTFGTPVGDLPIVSDSRWSASWTHHSLVAALVWILLMIVLQAVSWPLVRRIFVRFPDRGWGFGRLLTLLVSGYLVWFLASVELISFRAVWSWGAVASVAVGCWILGHWLGPVSTEDDWRPWRNKVIVSAELAFWAVFGLFLVFRLINPDSYHPVWGGEKPMEFAHINAILRSAHFPPVDPWYAGGYINYYYYGEYLVAFLIKLTGIPMEIAFNLAQPTMIALLASGGFSVSAAFGKHIFKGRKTGTIGAGIAGLLLLSLSGNLVEITRLIDRVLHGPPFVYEFGYWVWDPSRAIPNTITEFPYFSGVYADLHAHVVALPITVAVVGLVYSLVLDWRAVAVAASIPRVVPRIVLTLGIRLALLSLVLGTLWPTNAWDVPMYVAVSGVGMLMATRGIPSPWRRLAVAVSALVAVGILAYVLILPFVNHYVALFSSVKTEDAITPLVAVESHFGVFFLIAFVGCMYVLSRTGRLPHPLSAPTIPILAIGAALLFRWWAVDQTERIIQAADGITVVAVVGILIFGFVYAAPRRCDFGLPEYLPSLAVVLGGVAALILVLLERPVPALYLGIGIVAVGLWLTLTDTTDRFVAALIAGGMLLGAALEFVYLQDNLDGGAAYRMNTVFKFYNQLWVLFSLATAGLIARMAADLRETTVQEVKSMEVPTEVTTDHPGVPQSAQPIAQKRSGWSVAGLVLSAVLILASLAYPLHATNFRLDQHFAQASDGITLNAYDWMNYGEIPYGDGTMMSYKDDRAAIDWLNTNVHGSPVIAEATFGTYRCNGSRFSIATGLPDVVGWVNHETQQRPFGDLGLREQAMRNFYDTPNVSEKLDFIREYDVRYVIVGETERKYPVIDGNDCVPQGSSEGIEAIESMVGTDLEVAFTSGTTTIYRVMGATN